MVLNIKLELAEQASIVECQVDSTYMSVLLYKDSGHQNIRIIYDKQGSEYNVSKFIQGLITSSHVNISRIF